MTDPRFKKDIEMQPKILEWAVGLSAVFAVLATPPNVRAATVTVATKDSAESSRQSADFVGDGVGDQEEIHQALAALPQVGGTVLLAEGTYDIRRVPNTLGGVTIDRSRVTLAGQGAATRLVLAPNQDTNVIRIIGSGVGHVTIRDLTVDANRAQNSAGKGDPGISHDRFEFCGIKAFRRAPRDAAPGTDTHDITIRNCTVRNAHRLGIMLEGPNMRVLDNVLGNAGSDVVEILTGPGIIRGNYVEITARTHVAIGSDRGNSIVMAGNVVDVKPGGDLDIAFRSWADSQRHVIEGNVVVVDPQGRCPLAMDVRGFGATVTGNNVRGAGADKPARIKVGGGNTIITGNILENVVIEINDSSPRPKPIIVESNILENARLDHQQGKLVMP